MFNPKMYRSYECKWNEGLERDLEDAHGYCVAYDGSVWRNYAQRIFP